MLFRCQDGRIYASSPWHDRSRSRASACLPAVGIPPARLLTAMFALLGMQPEGGLNACFTAAG